MANTPENAPDKRGVFQTVKGFLFGELPWQQNLTRKWSGQPALDRLNESHAALFDGDVVGFVHKHNEASKLARAHRDAAGGFSGIWGGHEATTPTAPSPAAAAIPKTPEQNAK